MQAQKTAAKKSVLEYRTLLSETMLAEGLSNVGDSRRMERFLQKLLKGNCHICLIADPEWSCKMTAHCEAAYLQTKDLYNMTE